MPRYLDRCSISNSRVFDIYVTADHSILHHIYWATKCAVCGVGMLRLHFKQVGCQERSIQARSSRYAIGSLANGRKCLLAF